MRLLREGNAPVASSTKPPPPPPPPAPAGLVIRFLAPLALLALSCVNKRKKRAPCCSNGSNADEDEVDIDWEDLIELVEDGEGAPGDASGPSSSSSGASGRAPTLLSQAESRARIIDDLLEVCARGFFFLFFRAAQECLVVVAAHPRTYPRRTHAQLEAFLNQRVTEEKSAASRVQYFDCTAALPEEVCLVFFLLGSSCCSCCCCSLF